MKLEYQGANDRIVAGSFNDANEVSQLIQTLQGSQTTLAFTYDKAGNLREQGLSSNTKLRFTHDAWNRLVKVEHISSASFPEVVTTRGEYQYNGLFQRVVKRSDHDITDGNPALDEQRLLYYSGGWQVVEERVDDAWSSGHTTDRIIQHVWGLRYIDDAVLFRQDAGANGSYENTWYHLTDHQFSTIAVIDSSANLVERISYTPYGEARHHWSKDVDGDGDIDARDETLVGNASGSSIYQSGYRVDADFNRDGAIDRTDQSLINSRQYLGALPGGWISSLSTGNGFGYVGYAFNAETSQYTIRMRTFEPGWTGRWLERDPLLYLDGTNLYEYVGGEPNEWIDPYGLQRLSRDPEEDRRLKRDIPGFDDVYGPRAEYARHIRENLLEPAHDVAVVFWVGTGVIVLAWLTPVPDEWALIGLVFKSKRVQGLGLTTLSMLLRGKSVKEAERILRRLYGKPHYDTKGKKVWWNEEKKRSILIHDEPGHGGPHVQRQRRGCEFRPPDIPLTESWSP